MLYKIPKFNSNEEMLDWIAEHASEWGIEVADGVTHQASGETWVELSKGEVVKIAGFDPGQDVKRLFGEYDPINKKIILHNDAFKKQSMDEFSYLQVNMATKYHGNNLEETIVTASNMTAKESLIKSGILA